MPPAGVATGNGTAYNASARVSGAVNIATGSGAANGTSAEIGATTRLASATGTARQPAASLEGTSGIATGSGDAEAPAPAIGVHPTVGTGTGTAYDATTTATGPKDVFPGCATGTGQAYNAHCLAVRSHKLVGGKPWTPGRQIRVTAYAQLAYGYGRAYDAETSWDDDEMALILLLEGVRFP